MFRIAPWTKLLVVLSCWLWMSTTTGAFNYNNNNNAGIGSSIITINYSNPHTGNRRPQQSRTQPPPQRRVISLCSSTALTSPLQPVPEESSTINDNIGISDDGSKDDDSNNSIQLSSSTTNTGVQGDQKIQSTKQRQKLEYIQSEGGRFSFNTKYGALNPFAIYYGITSIVLGLPWFMALTVYQFLQLITFRRFDRLRRIPVLLNQLWGESLMVLTRCYPEMIHRDVLQKFYKEYVTSAVIINCCTCFRQKTTTDSHFPHSLSLLAFVVRGRPAMFVANHNSWMDIPFLGASIGWKNYKLISKAELAKVPILGKAIKVGGHIMVSRNDPRSQIKTLKQGIQLLKDGVHLCTYPEGTRTRNGRLAKFKNGAFKMAHKAGAPVIPISIVGAEKVMPIHWMFPHRPARGIAKVVIHEPVESVGKTEEELAQAVRNAIIAGLPLEQRPLKDEE